MAAFTSTTANCARCHTHKFDPITQEDYYSLQAVFAGILKGDVAFDRDVKVARQRSRWQSFLAACEQQNATELLSDNSAPAIVSWIDQQAAVASWRSLALETFVSTGGV